MAGQPVVAANAPVSNPMEMIAQGYSPATAVAAQRSKYLAQALASMQQQGENIRTPVALGANLLAEALYQRKYGQAMQDFATAARGDQGAFNNTIFGGLNADGAAQPAAAPPAAPAGGPAPAPAPGASVTPPPAPTPQNTAPPISPVVLRTIAGEAGGDPNGQRAVYQAILKRSAESGLTPEQVVTAPGQFEGLHAPWLAKVGDNDPLFSHVAANVAGAQAGQFDSFYSPSGQAALGRQPPAWANGPGVDVGGNSFYQTGYQAPPGMRAAPTGQASYAPAGQPGPLQVTSSPQGTPIPPSPSPSAGVPPPSTPGGPASAPPAAAFPAAGGASAPQAYHQPVTQAEIDYARQLASNPMTRNRGIQLAMELRQRQLTPIEPKVETTAGGQIVRDPYGRAAPVYQPIPGAPTETKSMMTMGPKGSYQQVSGPMTEGQVNALAARRDKFMDSDEYKTYNNALVGLNSLNDALSRATKNNGVLDQAAADNLVRAETGLSARQGSIQMMLDHLGAPQEFIGKVQNLFGNGFVTPESLQSIRAMLGSYVRAHKQIADNRLAQDNTFAQSMFGRDLGVKLTDASPDANVQWLTGGAPGPQPRPVPTPQPAPQSAGGGQPRVLTYNPATGGLQ